MSNCNKISELLSAYIDNEVTAKEKELVEQHIKECTSCKQKLDLMLKTQNILKATPQVPVPETLLKDFEEYKKKSEQTEKKVVPFYRNYRIYATIAAIFIFAFVLKSGLWQDDKFVPDTLTQDQKTEQTLNAPVNNDQTKADDTSATEVKTKENTVTKQNEKSRSMPASDQTPEVDTNTDVQTESAQHTPAVAEATEEQGSAGGSAVYDETQEVSPMSRRTTEPVAQETEAEVPSHAIVYVSAEDLAKAAQLLSDGKYFYAQVEQKLNDNRIPFESNYLSLDESVPHKVVVMVKE